MLKMILFVVLVWLPFGALAEFALQREVPVDSHAGLTETVWETGVPPGSDYDRVALHRYAADGPHHGAVLYLPGTNMNGELAIADEQHNLWLYLANRGYAVYALDYRTHFVPAEPVPDTAFMQDWTLARFVDDFVLTFDFVRSQHAERSRGEEVPVFVAGFSRGVSYAYMLAGQRDLAGLIALDGSFKSFEHKDFDLAAALTTLEASGAWASVMSRSRGWQGRTQLMRRTWQDPSGPAMAEGYRTIGDQLTATLYNAWGPGALANPVDGVSDIAVLAKAMEGYDRLFPARHNAEGASIARQADDPATFLDDHFGHMTVPIIFFGATNLGADHLMNGIYSASRSGSKDVRLHVLENYGHLDVLFGNQAAEDVFAPLLAWLRKRTPDHTQ